MRVPKSLNSLALGIVDVGWVLLDYVTTAYRGKVEIRWVLLDHHGAVANMRDNQDRTLLHSVAEGGYHHSKHRDRRVSSLLLLFIADFHGW